MRSVFSFRRDRARRRADRNVRPTVIYRFSQQVSLESLLVVVVGERCLFGLACHAKEDGDSRDRRSPERQMRERDVERNTALVQRCKPGSLAHFRGVCRSGERRSQYGIDSGVYMEFRRRRFLSALLELGFRVTVLPPKGLSCIHQDISGLYSRA